MIYQNVLKAFFIKKENYSCPINSLIAIRRSIPKEIFMFFVDDLIDNKI